MKKITEEKLFKILKGLNIEDHVQYCNEYLADSMQFDDNSLDYVKEKIKKSKLTQQEVFLQADISQRYGYKLLSGEKHTKRRDIILRLCYAAQLTLDQIQYALIKYNLPTLNPFIARDALLIIIFNHRPGDIHMVNQILIEHGFNELETTGQER